MATTIPNGSKYMQAVTYTGTGATQTITVGFQPDLVWIKSRSATTDHKLTDSVRGVTKALISDTTGAETTDTNGVTAFTSNGFTLGSDSVYNTNAATYVAWCWQAGQGSSSSNTSGSITSTVSVNATAGFSVVTWNQNAAPSTVGHGLGIAPAMIIAKNRTGTPDNWLIYHKSLGATKYLFLNTTAAAGTSSAVWNNTEPTSSVFSYGTGLVTGNFVAYCWAEIAGFSKFGSYTGNGSTDGPFIYTGFRPNFIIRKESSAVGDWIIFDNARNPYNVETYRLLANTTAAEASPGNNIDVLSNGWKERNNDGYSNNSGSTYIYMAFAENPFKNANAR